MGAKSIARSFAGGEITEELYGRADLVKHQTGLAIARNCQILPHGPVQNRAGFEYVLEVKDSNKRTRLLPFSFNTEQTFILEFGDQYIRIHTMGGTLLEASQAISFITFADPGVLTYVGADPANGDWFYLAGIGGMDELNGRYVKVKNVNAGANTFELSDIHGGADIDTTFFTPYTAGGTMSRVYEVATPFLEADLFDVHFTQSNDVLTLVHPSYAPRELRRLGPTNWQLVTISFTPSIATPVAPILTTSGPGGGTPIDNVYVYTAVSADTLEESFPSPSSNVAYDLTVAGNRITIGVTPVVGAVRYNFYKLAGGVYGYIGQSPTDFADSNITPDTSRTPPNSNNPFISANNYPGAVGYHEQRRAFAGTNNQPKNFWATVSGTESNLSYSIPTRESDAIQFRVAAGENNRIRHIVSFDQLFLLTSGSEIRVQPQNSDILTPASAAPKEFSFEGASNVQPVKVKASTIFVHDSNNHWLELSYQGSSDGSSVSLAVNDLSVMAPHLVDGFTMVDFAYSKSPHKTVWGVRSDGVLIGMTYLPEHQVAAFHRHDTKSNYLNAGGESVEADSHFESCACVKEGKEWPLYVVVQRFINGRNVRYIERMHTRAAATLADAFHVDSGASYAGAPVSSLRGFWHLEGCELAFLADGAVVTGLRVERGEIQCPSTFSKAAGGLRVTSDIRLIPLALEASALGQGTMKDINEVYLRVKQSSGFSVGPTFDDADLVEWTVRTDEDYGAPPALFSGIVPIVIQPAWGQDVQLCIRQTAPLPFTISSIALDTALGD